MANSKDKLDAILDKLKKLDTLESKIDSFSADLKGLTARVTSLHADIENTREDVTANTQAIHDLRGEFLSNKMTTNAQIHALQNNLNIREQQLKACTIRIFNLPIIVGEGADNYKMLSIRVYDVLRPLLVAAKAAGDVATVQQQHNVIESCYRLQASDDPKPGSPPPPVIVKLASKQTKIAIMKHRKRGTPGDENENGADAAGATGGKRRGRGIIIVEDLTVPTYKMLTALRADPRTDKVWTVNGQIFYSLVGKHGYKRVRNVFDSLYEILGPSFVSAPSATSPPSTT